jgi:hypothetical protein
LRFNPVLKEASGAIEREIKGGKLPLWGFKNYLLFCQHHNSNKAQNLTSKSQPKPYRVNPQNPNLSIKIRVKTQSRAIPLKKRYKLV